MNGFTVNGVTLFLGHIPFAKSLCFYFQKGGAIYPVAYVSQKCEGDARQMWTEMLGENICATCGKPIEPGQDFVDDPLRPSGAECANKKGD